MADPAPPALWGRSIERQQCDDALARIRSGRSVVLVVRGDAGIGKTALLQDVAGKAADSRVVSVSGIESEFQLPFAALHQLCQPLLDGLDHLPPPQRRALQVTFGATDGNPPDRLLLGLSVLGLLAEAAARRPLVCLVDDAHWLDEATRQILGVVARRLQAESVLLLLAVRESGDHRLFAGLPELTVGGLPDEAARALLASKAAIHLDTQVRDRLVAETDGNPLALIELAESLTEAELAGGFGPAEGPMPGQLSEEYQRRIRTLSDETQRLMLVAAADPTGDATLLWRAAQRLGIPRSAAVIAEREQLLDVQTRVRFRHPLIRSAAYAAGSAEDRRAAHRALAESTATDDPDRRIWHLAAAADGPDPGVADDLERSAVRAQSRAGLAAAAAFLERSAELTPEPAVRADRSLAAAHAHLHAGAFETAMSLLAQADADAGTDLQRARAEQLRAEITRAATSGREAPALLLHSAGRLERLDAALARETYLDAWGAALVAGPFAPPGGRLTEVSEAARAAGPVPESPGPGDLLLDGLSTFILEPPAAAGPPLRRAVQAMLDGEATTEQWLHWGVLAANAALAVWDFDSWAAISDRYREYARSAGALAPLSASFNIHRVIALWRGDFQTAEDLGIEERVVKDVTGIRRTSYGDLFLAAYRGIPEQAKPLIAATAKEAAARGEGLGQQFADRAAALLCNGLGRYPDALAAAERAAGGNLGPFTAQALPDLVEAAVRAGAVEQARIALHRLEGYTAVAESDWGAGLAARSRALLAEGAAADTGYADAVERLGRTSLRPELARAHLLYGEWLRREGRRVDARNHLRTAYDVFVDIGAEAFADRTRHELLATGEKVRKRNVDTLNDLTPQEEHIARLARSGRTNPEIAAELYISARTVEWHLRKVFDKLGITSRRELREALPSASMGQPHGR